MTILDVMQAQQWQMAQGQRQYTAEDMIRDAERELGELNETVTRLTRFIEKAREMQKRGGK